MLLNHKGRFDVTAALKEILRFDPCQTIKDLKDAPLTE